MKKIEMLFFITSISIQPVDPKDFLKVSTRYYSKQ